MKLQDHFTLFILPFTYDSIRLEEITKSSIWVTSDIKIEKSFLYEHVQKYLLPPQKSGATQIYMLKENFKETNHASSKISNLFCKKLQMKLPGKAGNYINFKFINQNSKINSPKLILFPLASIGFLTFGIKLVPENEDIKDLITLNYNLHKYNYSNNTLIKILPDSTREEELNSIKICHEKIQSYQSIKKRTNKQEKDYWEFSNLIELFLESIWTNIKLNNSGRFHLFTYYQIDSPNEAQQEIEIDFIRILRNQNQNYNPIAEDHEGNPLLKKTFEEIYIGASVESGGIMINKQNRNLEFFSNFMEGSLLNRYLWIYILVLHQRITLIKMISNISKTTIIGKESEKSYLLNIVSSLSSILLKTSFPDISDFTQFNTYYAFLSKNLNIKAYQNELKNKITELKNIIEEKLEVEEKRKAHRLEIILAVLLIPQILFAFLSLLSEYFNVKTSHSLFVHHFAQKGIAGVFEIIVLSCWILLFILIWHILRDITKKCK